MNLFASLFVLFAQAQSVSDSAVKELDLGGGRSLRGTIVKETAEQYFVDLGPTEGRGERVISALGVPYTNMDAACIVV